MDQEEQGIMTYFESEAHSFVMRIWRENREDPSQQGPWRGWIEHVQSGERHYFQSVAEIPQIVSGYIGDPAKLDAQVFMPVQANREQK
ncbi:MAG: hypothetical protein ACWGPS_10955 [Candidatus Promineifilaceae bacterium]